MANERTIPSASAKSVVTFNILSDGREVSREYHVLSIVVNKEVNRIPSANLILLDGEASEQTFEISNSPDFEPGKTIEVLAGYTNDEHSLFSGIIIKHSIKVRKRESVLLIECRDKAVKMTGRCRNSYFKEQTDSEIMESLIDAHGLEGEVEATTLKHRQLVQYNATDWDFMLCRCDASGLLCFTNDNKITIKRPLFEEDVALTIQYGATVLDLDAEIDARSQYKTIKGSSWDYSEQALLDSVEADDLELPDAGNLSSDVLAAVMDEDHFQLQHSGKLEEPELQSWVNAKMLKHKLAKIRGKVRTDGTAAVIPGQMIQLNGVGERFEGKLFVSGIRHEIQGGTWQTIFQFGLNPEWFAETYDLQQPLAGALLPAIEGLLMGVVTQLQDDPDGENRILVRIPVIHKEEEGAWCRISSLDAGENRGMFFRPEIGDEVVVGFINNDPRHGVVLGMCNSSAHPAALQASDNNHEKGYVSRSEMKIIFNDDEKSITIRTPGGNQMEMSEVNKGLLLKDQNGNKLSLNSEGITLESAKDIVLKASGDVKAEGVNMNIKGSAQVKVEGGAGAEISSGGTTIVKGAMVNIN